MSVGYADGQVQESRQQFQSAQSDLSDQLDRARQEKSSVDKARRQLEEHRQELQNEVKQLQQHRQETDRKRKQQDQQVSELSVRLQEAERVKQDLGSKQSRLQVRAGAMPNPFFAQHEFRADATQQKRCSTHSSEDGKK